MATPATTVATRRSESRLDSAKSDRLVAKSSSTGALLPTHVVARLAWSSQNRAIVAAEQRKKEEHRRLLEERARLLYERVQTERAARLGLDRAAVEGARERNWQFAEGERRIQAEDTAIRAAKQRALVEKVRERREAAVGRVSASRQALMESNQRTRRAEGVRQRFALDEKARRLAVLRDEHMKRLAERYVAFPSGGVGSNELFRDDSFRLLATGGMSARLRDARLNDQRFSAPRLSSRQRPTSAADFRSPARASGTPDFRPERSLRSSQESLA